ncbi:MAG: hypothetical protein AAB420_03925 [Patescibacteria group bacterium]
MVGSKKQKLPPDSGRTKTVAGEGDPVVVVADVARPVQVGLALITVEVDVAHLLVAIERVVSNTILTTTA